MRPTLKSFSDIRIKNKISTQFENNFGMIFPQQNSLPVRVPTGIGAYRLQRRGQLQLEVLSCLVNSLLTHSNTTQHISSRTSNINKQINIYIYAHNLSSSSSHLTFSEPLQLYTNPQNKITVQAECLKTHK